MVLHLALVAAQLMQIRVLQLVLLTISVHTLIYKVFRALEEQLLLDQVLIFTHVHLVQLDNIAILLIAEGVTILKW